MSTFGAIKSSLSQLRLDPADATKIQYCLPQYTTVQRDLLTPRTGDLIQNSTLDAEQHYTGSAWIDVGTYLNSGAGAIRRTVTQKFDDLPISVKDFGAAGDGTTADTAAIQAAVTR